MSDESSQSPLPTITKDESKWMEHVAGLRASQDAATKGGDPLVTRAVVAAASPFPQLGGFLLEPPSAGHLYILGELSDYLERQGAKEPGLAVAWCLLCGQEVLRLLENTALTEPDRVAAIRRALFTFGACFHGAEIKELNDWVTAEFQALSGNTAKKLKGE